MRMSLENSVNIQPSERSEMHAVKFQAQQQQQQQASNAFRPVEFQKQSEQHVVNVVNIVNVVTPVPSPSTMSLMPSLSGTVITGQVIRGNEEKTTDRSDPPLPPPPLPIREIPMAREISPSDFTDFSRISHSEAFVLHLVLGLFGAVHFRMGRYGLGFIYFFTVGGFGFGWVVDLFRLPCLVEEYNQNHGKWAGHESKTTLIGDMYALWVLSLFGVNHLYLGRFSWAALYLCTCGVFGMGTVFDLFRTPFLVNDYFEKRDGRGANGKIESYSLADAYLMWFPPLGLFGAHHLYLGDTPKFILYFFTVGLFGLGWLVDMFTLPGVVKLANQRIAIKADMNAGLAEAHYV